MKRAVKTSCFGLNQYVHFLCRGCWMIVIGLLYLNNASAQSYKLHDDLINNRSVDAFQISADGARVVYQDSVDELYSVPIIGGEIGSTITKLNAEFPSFDHGVQRDFQISADGSRVVYRADQDINNSYELFSVPITGATTSNPIVKLNDELVNYGSVREFQISADGTRVVYRGQGINNSEELFSVPITGATTTNPVIKLNDELPGSFADVVDFLISPDSLRVVYTAEQQTVGVRELYSVPITGATLANPITKLSRALPVDGGIFSFQISADSLRVVYTGTQQRINAEELYSVPITGPTLTHPVIKLSEEFENFGHIEDTFQINADSTRVVYVADYQANGIDELYSVPITGATTIDPVAKLNEEIQMYGDVSKFLISPDGNRVIYVADGDIDNFDELYSVMITGPTPTNPIVKLDLGIMLGDIVFFDGISPDGSQITYRVRRDGGAHELYSAMISDDALVSHITKLNGGLISDSNVRSASQISADGSRVIYQGYQDNDELFGVPLDTCSASSVPVSNALCQENTEGITDWDSQARPNAIEQTVTFGATDAIITGAILDLRGLSHTYRDDVLLELIAPNGNTLQVHSFPAGSTASANYGGEYRFADGNPTLIDTTADADGTTFDTHGIVPPGTYAPGENRNPSSFASSFKGLNPEGTWTLKMQDLAEDDTGVLSSWRLILLTEESSSFFMIKAKNGNVITIEL